jgi:adenylate cyclase
METNNSPTSRLLLEILPDFAHRKDIREIFPQSKFLYLKKNNIRTACIVSSEPIDSRFYRAIVGAFNRNGITVLSFYLNTLDESGLDTLLGAVQELKKSLSRGGCMVLSYKSRHALTLIAALYVYNGTTPGVAAARVGKIKKDGPGKNADKDILEKFRKYITHQPGAGMKVLNAIRIDTPFQGERRAALTHGEQPSSEIHSPRTQAAKTPSRPTPVDATPAKKGPFYRSIRFKLISIISVIIIASLTGMIFLATRYFKEDNKVRIQENNLQLAEVIALKMKSEIDRYRIMSSIMLDVGGKKGVTEYEDMVSAGSKDVIFSGIMGKTGSTLKFIKTYFNKPLMNRHAISEKDIVNLNGANAAMYGQSLAGENIIANASPYFNLPVMLLSFPFRQGPDGSVRAIMVSIIRMENLLKTFSTAGIIKVFMVNYKGDVIAHPDISHVLGGTSLSRLPICTLMMKSTIDNGQTRYRDAKGVYYLGSFKKIDSDGFGIIAEAREKEAFQSVYLIQERNMIITGMVLIVAVLFIFFFGKTITSPIIKLVAATRQIIQGQYHVDIVPSTRDEIGQLTSTFIEMGKGLEEREKIKSAFGKFVNKELAEAALRDEIRLGGERKNVTILFSDIRSFTEISERMEPEQVVEFLNGYMTKMVYCVEAMNGIVDKFIGDAIMAVWGTPIARDNDAERAVNSALLMRKELVALNREKSGPINPALRIGCGINTGTVLAGQIGSENRMEYTVIGDPVNLASRIESLNKPFGTDILISDNTYRLVRDVFAVERMKQIRVKGKSEEQQIYAVLGRLDDPERPKSVAELRAMLGIDTPAQVSDEELMKTFDQGEEKYEIVQK